MNRLPSHNSFAKIVICVWLFLWVLVIPLIHVHPEIDHHHGEPGHVHSGIIHTVFSPDLECEYTGNPHEVTSQSKISSTTLQGDGHGEHVLNHFEISWVLLSSSSNNLNWALLSTPTALPGYFRYELFSETHSSKLEIISPSPPTHYVSSTLSPRAPPFRLT